ncbi:hypothetical protein [Streptomyces fulvorobeus]|uniref:Uncharacterized protein n=2 Tax=Streptomyces fulvorobeus TaxID=284028 RepID=A0A7Y9HIH0_9ACTN|nr:hypothetical protein [Streptomyces fulvorobeus]NYE44868.1 hypothetical protein [Streptomyces fulvorobeus]
MGTTVFPEGGMMYDLTNIPAHPLYALMIRPDDVAGFILTLDGQVISSGHDLKEVREEGRTELRVRAALAARPVRARAVESASPAPWNMIIFPDGSVVDVASHPTPPTEPHTPPCRGATAAPADHADHPHAIGIRAWRALTDPATTYSAETVELLVETAERLLEAGAASGTGRADLLRVIRNAHSVWHVIRDTDPETALDLAPRLLALLRGSHPRRTADVIEWATTRRTV